MEEDRILYPYVEAVREMVATGELVQAVNQQVTDIWRLDIK